MTALEWKLCPQMSGMQGSLQRTSLGQGRCSMYREARKQGQATGEGAKEKGIYQQFAALLSSWLLGKAALRHW